MNSAAIQDMQYDRENKTLDIQFCSGSVYRYRDVPEYVATDVSFGDAMATTLGSSPCGSWYPGKSPSVGAAFNQYVKDRYPYERIS